MMTVDEAGALKALRQAHPDWDRIGTDRGGYSAVQKPTRTRLHYLWAETIEELAALLAEADR